MLVLQRNSSLPDDTNVARLQEELIGVKLREAEALTGLKELRQQVRDLEEHWQVGTKVFCHFIDDNGSSSSSSKNNINTNDSLILSQSLFHFSVT